jgi:predicted nuclease of restriction endonuclease-like (RecB) superfamily
VGRRTAARSINALMTATYWLVGRRIVESEQGGQGRAAYGQALLERLSTDLKRQFGRGFGADNLELMRPFYQGHPPGEISESVIRKSRTKTSRAKSESPVPIFSLPRLAECFPLSWTHYVRLVRRKRSPEERMFYETEALRGGRSVRQLERQMGSQFYTRTLLSKDKRDARKGLRCRTRRPVTPEEAIKDPYVLEFLNLRTSTPKATLRCLVIIDLKLTELSHDDGGQMHKCCNYAKEHWTLLDENPPVGLVLCARTHAAIARYALDGLPNNVPAAEYHTVLPDEQLLANELAKTRREWEAQHPIQLDSGRKQD